MTWSTVIGQILRGTNTFAIIALDDDPIGIANRRRNPLCYPALDLLVRDEVAALRSSARRDVTQIGLGSVGLESDNVFDVLPLPRAQVFEELVNVFAAFFNNLTP